MSTPYQTAPLQKVPTRDTIDELRHRAARDVDIPVSENSYDDETVRLIESRADRLAHDPGKPAETPQ